MLSVAYGLDEVISKKDLHKAIKDISDQSTEPLVGEIYWLLTEFKNIECSRDPFTALDPLYDLDLGTAVELDPD
jgi:hypothetical protein